MYNQKLVASIKANGKILREFKDTVYIPFSSEYSILLKNLNTVRALVHVYIDGEDQTPGGLVVNVGQEIDLERSIKNGNLLEGNRFKFIERTSAVEQHRGIKLEDGVVRIEYQFERVLTLPPSWQSFPNSTGVWQGKDYITSNMLRTADTLIGTTQMSAISSTSAEVKSYANDAGITVPGSRSNQKFSTVSNFLLEDQRHTIVLKLLGETADNKPVEKPVTVKHKPRCQTCGKQNKATAKFCSECGTSLEIFA
jgi:hypothetical protein